MIYITPVLFLYFNIAEIKINFSKNKIKWGRIGPFIIGILLGYKIFIDRKKPYNTIKIVIYIY
jgi:hypothetical protein